MNSKITQWGKTGFAVLMLAWIAHILYCVIQYAMATPLPFDGAMNLNVAASFIQGHGYGFFYDSFFPFPVQTGGTLVLPAAMALWLFGTTPFTAQLASIFYLCEFIIVVYILFRIFELPVALSLFGVVLCLRTPGITGFGNYAINGYGELPCLVYFLIGIIILSCALRGAGAGRRKLLLGGTALGLSFITKVVSLLLIGPAAILLLFFLKDGAERRRELFYICSGIAIPVAGWELFRLLQLGSGHEYLTWWRLQLDQILFQSGFAFDGFADAGVFRKVYAHFMSMSASTGLPPVLVPVQLAALLFGAFLTIPLFNRERDRPAAYIFTTLILSVTLWLGWWLVLLPNAWLRRLVDEFLLQQVLVLLVLFFLCRGAVPLFGMPWTFKKISYTACAAALLTSQAYVSARGGIFSASPRPGNWDAAQLYAAKLIKDLPNDAVLLGAGWWKAPALALFSGKQILNFDRQLHTELSVIPRKFLVMDGWSIFYAHAEFEEILKLAKYRTIYETPAAAIYELVSIAPYDPFQAWERIAPDLRSGFDAAKEDYPYVRGLHPAIKGSRWSSTESGFLLKRSRQKRLRLALTVPEPVLGSVAGHSQLRILVSSPGCINTALKAAAGPQLFDVPITCPPKNVPETLEVSVRINGHMPFTQQIDMDLVQKRLGFIFESAQLSGGT